MLPEQISWIIEEYGISRAALAVRKARVSNGRGGSPGSEGQPAPYSIRDLRFTSLRSRLLHKLQGHAVHAVTQPRRFRSIIENVSGVSIAPRTQHFGAGHSQTSINFFPHAFLFDRSPNTRPDGAGIKLRLRTKQRQLARGAFKGTCVMIVVERARVGSLSSLLPHDVVLLRGEYLLPLCICLNHFSDSFGFQVCSLSPWKRFGMRA